MRRVVNVICYCTISLALLVTAASCGSSSTSGGGGGVTVTITLAPVTGAADQTTTVAVTGTFSGAITTPSAWSNVFTLTKQNETTNLCTATSGGDTGYSYDSTNRIVTCIHDALENGSAYTATIVGLTDSAGATITTATSTFQIVAAAGEFTLSSADLPLGQEIGATYVGGVDQGGCGGENKSPVLSWSDVPDGALSLAVTVVDINATSPEDPTMYWTHWIVYNIDPAVTSLARNTTAAAITGSTGGTATFGPNEYDGNPHEYGGPCPPSGTHTYRFSVWALNVEDLSAQGIDMESAPAILAAILNTYQIDRALLDRDYTTTE